MKSLRVALLALSALVVAGCAPSVVGGTYRTATVQVMGWEANSLTLEFLDATSVRIGMVQGRALLCRARHDLSVVRPWRFDSDGKIVLSVGGTCVLNVPGCGPDGEPNGQPDGGNACGFFSQAIGPTLEQRADSLLIADTGLQFNRR